MLSAWKVALFLPFLAIIYEFWISDLVFVTWGLRRVAQPIETSPYKCRRLQEKHFEQCGYLWLDERGRMLYAVCGSRKVIAIDIKEPKNDGSYKVVEIEPAGPGGRSWSGTLDVAGFVGEHVDESNLRFWFVNRRHPVGSKGESLAVRKYGHNITIDGFDLAKKGKLMRHYKTIYDYSIYSPNGIAFMGADSIVVNNDRSRGLRELFDRWVGGGDLVYYDGWWKKNGTVTLTKLRKPQGIARGSDDRIYVGSAVDGKIYVYRLREGDWYRRDHIIRLNYPVEALSVDSQGIIWALTKSKYDPKGKKSTNTIFKIQRWNQIKDRFQRTKVLEDPKRKMLNGVTDVRHDVESDTLFFGGHSMPFLTVCKKK